MFLFFFLFSFFRFCCVGATAVERRRMWAVRSNWWIGNDVRVVRCGKATRGGVATPCGSFPSFSDRWNERLSGWQFVGAVSAPTLLFLARWTSSLLTLGEETTLRSTLSNKYVIWRSDAIPAQFRLGVTNWVVMFFLCYFSFRIFFLLLFVRMMWVELWMDIFCLLVVFYGSCIGDNAYVERKLTYSCGWNGNKK